MTTIEPAEVTISAATEPYLTLLQSLSVVVNEVTDHRYAALLTPDTPLLSSGIVDSLALGELIDCIEENFGWRLTPNELAFDTADTLEQIARLLIERDG